MISRKPVLNKFYIYAGSFVKIKKIQKSMNKIHLESLESGEMTVIPYQHCELLISRIYTVGEVAKILEKRADTLRKYEKRNLIPASKKFGPKYKSYENWRFYEESDVYELVEFFDTRVPGRPVSKGADSVDAKIKTIQEKIKLTFKEKI